MIYAHYIGIISLLPTLSLYIHVYCIFSLRYLLYYMIYAYMYVYRIKNPHVSTCMWSQEWVAAALCPWNPSTAGGSMRVQGKCDEFGEKMFDTHGKYMDLMMCVEIISHKFDLETHVSRLDLLVIRFGQRTNLKLMRKKITKSTTSPPTLHWMWCPRDSGDAQDAQFTFLRPK